MAIVVSLFDLEGLTSNATTITNTFSSGVITTGDLLICVLQKDGNSASTTNDGGWTNLFSETNDGAAYTEVWYKEAVSADESVTTYTWGTDNESWISAIYRITGADTTPVTLETATGTSTAPATPATTASSGSSTILAGSGNDTGLQSNTIDATVTDNLVESRPYQNSQGTTLSCGTFEDGDVNIPALTHSLTGSEQWLAFVVEIKLAVAGDVDITCVQGNLDLSSVAPTLGLTVKVAVPQGDLVIDSVAPVVDVTAGVNVAVPQGDLVIDSVALTVGITESVNVFPPQGDLVLSGTAPVVDVTVTAAGGVYPVEEVLLREPNLWVPGKKPVGPVRIDPSKASGIYASYLFSANSVLKALKGDNLFSSYDLGKRAIITQYGSSLYMLPYQDGYHSAKTHKNSSEFTREFLYEPLGTGTDYAIIVTAEAPGDGQRDRSVSVNTSNLFNAYVYDGSTQNITSTTSVALNTQYHVAVTISSAGFRIYVNGVLEDSDAGVTSAYTAYASPELVIGYGNNISATSGHNGRLYMLNDWTVALTDAEIKERAYDPYGHLIPA